ncbi:hypothetical protein [Lentisalinibacter salinarum]|uniref:hypothetical protein n=1 Tax=Lentisalinibacter salinarum TaxID=2992239 RepID=UPI00386B3180
MCSKIQRLEGLAAVLADEAGHAREIDPALGLSAEDRGELANFAESGWEIVPADEGDAESRRLYRDDAGHVLIEGQFVTVRANAGVTREEIEALAEEHGLSVHRTLGLKRNTFQLAPVSGRGVRPEPVEVCSELEKDRRVLWAEPSFIEALGIRIPADR